MRARYDDESTVNVDFRDGEISTYTNAKNKTSNALSRLERVRALALSEAGPQNLPPLTPRGGLTRPEEHNRTEDLAYVHVTRDLLVDMARVVERDGQRGTPGEVTWKDGKRNDLPHDDVNGVAERLGRLNQVEHVGSVFLRGEYADASSLYVHFTSKSQVFMSRAKVANSEAEDRLFECRNLAEMGGAPKRASLYYISEAQTAILMAMLCAAILPGLLPFLPVYNTWPAALRWSINALQLAGLAATVLVPRRWRKEADTFTPDAVVLRYPKYNSRVSWKVVGGWIVGAIVLVFTVWAALK